MHFLPLCELSAIVWTFCHCVYFLPLRQCTVPLHCTNAPLYFLPLHQCTVPLLCTIVHCTTVLFAIAPLCCSIATMLHFIGTFHLTIALFLSMHTLPLHLRPLQLLSLHFYLESLFLLTLQYIHYPNIHYQNVARFIIKPIINTYIYALQSVDKSIQAQFSGRNWVSTLPRSFCTFTISHLSVGHFCKMSEILSFIASLLTERSLPWIKKYYDTVVCCDTYCHKLQMNNVYERFSLYFNETSNTFHVSGFPQPQYRWLKDGDYISGFSSEHFYKVSFGIKKYPVF